MNVVIGYVVSWIGFLLLLPIFIGIFGKITGPILNYGLSWIVWLIAAYYLHKLNPNGEMPEY